MHLGRRHFVLGDHTREIAGDVCFVAVMRLAVLFGEACVLIAGVFAVVVLCASRLLDDCRIDHRAFAHEKTLRIKVFDDGLEELVVEPGFAEPLAKLDEGDLVGCGIGEG